MSKEETPITAEEFIKSKNVEFYLQDETMDIICNLMEPYAQAKVEELHKRIKELEKENQELNGYVNYWTSLAHKRKDQITQLQKKIELYEKAIEDIENNFCSNDVGHLLDKLKESLTNKKEG